MPYYSLALSIVHRCHPPTHSPTLALFRLTPHLVCSCSRPLPTLPSPLLSPLLPNFSRRRQRAIASVQANDVENTESTFVRLLDDQTFERTYSHELKPNEVTLPPNSIHILYRSAVTAGGQEAFLW